MEKVLLHDEKMTRKERARRRGREGEEEKGERTRLGAEKVSEKNGKEHRH